MDTQRDTVAMPNRGVTLPLSDVVWGMALVRQALIVLGTALGRRLRQRAREVWGDDCLVSIRSIVGPRSLVGEAGDYLDVDVIALVLVTKASELGLSSSPWGHAHLSPLSHREDAVVTSLKAVQWTRQRLAHDEGKRNEEAMQGKLTSEDVMYMLESVCRCLSMFQGLDGEEATVRALK